VLAAIISLLQDQPQPRPTPKAPLVFDMGGGGAIGPRYELIDYLNALGTFREIAGEHPVARAQRRTEHVGRELARGATDRESLERAMAIGVLIGAGLERKAQAERERELAAADAAKAVLAIVQPMPQMERRPPRADSEIGAGGMLALLAIGAGISIALTRALGRR
jgi:hypothetical protein